MKKIISLTKVFIKEFYQNLPVFSKQKKGNSKKSIFFWLIAIIVIAVTYVSHQVIVFLVDAKQPEIFLNIYFSILAVVLLFQTILVCNNLFFFSKDIEKILHMPLKPVELLLAKFSTLLFMLYLTEGILGIIPFTLYGMLTNAHFSFFLWEVIILMIFPIFIATLISTIMFLIMRIGKYIKNKEIFQFFITTMLIMLLLTIEFRVVNNLFGIGNDQQALEQFSNFSQKAQQANQYFLIINPSVTILTNPTEITAMLSVMKLLGYNIISGFIFIAIGKRTYIKDILKNMLSNSNKKTKEINNKKDIKGSSIRSSYIRKEIKLLIREPIFFMQCVLPVISIIITCLIIMVILVPTIQEMMRQEETIQNAFQNLSFNMEAACDILIILQVLFSLSSISLTAISREGKNAVFIKYIPIELHKQFFYKSIPQIVLNFLVTIVVFAMVSYLLPNSNWLYLGITFMIATIMNGINSYLMLIVDLVRPNLDWDTTYSVVKKSDNKVFQYAFMIIHILFLMYLAKIFKNVDIIVALMGETIIYVILLFIIVKAVKKWQKKLFRKII